MKKFTFFLAGFFALQLHAQPIQRVEQMIQNLTTRVSNIDTKLTNGFAGMNKNIKQFATEKASPLTNKPAFLSGDFFSPDVLQKLTNAIEMARSAISSEAAAFRTFAGPDGKGNPGTQCFKFKSDIVGLINNIENLKGSLIGANGRNPIGERLEGLVEKLPPAGLFPIYSTMGSMINTLNQRIQVFAQNEKILFPFLKETALGNNAPMRSMQGGTTYQPVMNNENAVYHLNDLRQNSFASSGYAFTASYSLKPETESKPFAIRIDTALETVELGKLCNVNRVNLGNIIWATKEQLIGWDLAADIFSDAESKKAEVGGSVVAEGTVTIEMNPVKKIGTVMKWISETFKLMLDNASGTLDQCDLLRAQKIVADNQQKIVDNQKLLLEQMKEIKK